MLLLLLLFVFLLLIQLPPISTLFPYTTLFRSLHGLCRRRVLPRRRHARGATCAGCRCRETRCRVPVQHVRLPDRKSTRLNSSHPSISYAVFCLKKKKFMENR